MKKLSTLRKILVIVSMGGCLQITACQGSNTRDLIISGVKDTMVNVGTALVASTADSFLGLN